MRKQLGIFLLVLTIAIGFSGAVTAANSSDKAMMSSNNVQMHMTHSQMMQMMKAMHLTNMQMVQMMQMMKIMQNMHLTKTQMMQMMQMCMKMMQMMGTHMHTR